MPHISSRSMECECTVEPTAYWGTKLFFETGRTLVFTESALLGSRASINRPGHFSCDRPSTYVGGGEHSATAIEATLGSRVSSSPSRLQERKYGPSLLIAIARWR